MGESENMCACKCEYSWVNLKTCACKCEYSWVNLKTCVLANVSTHG